ncbi:nucleotide sugar dehydrogenase [Halobaculum magnesiiphilum]|uniref:UDP-N-acetyl-D-mannosamine dehydrogenase n=1 Tax=Halobaculum magnesiiphilum TaxID=1017351 RepID=A0A8T8WIP1_9EURY|nr:nucleotide sugar dehydrogenase [Halobaculum magnesiiphilum]QZP39697.1 nucleotide sugar dehydrogenase [Halobaculum magnesiiphilum]
MSERAELAAPLYGSDRSESAQREAFTRGEYPVTVYGLGKMGLPIATVFAETTGTVTGVDIDESVVDRVNDGDCHVRNEPGLDEAVADLVADGALRATTDGAAAAEGARIHVVIVPTLITEDHQPDTSVVTSVARDIAEGLAPGDLVCVESTLPPGTCRDVLAPLLRYESGLDDGEFGIAFCPERTSSGRALADVRGSHPKVVGGVDAESTRAAALAYDELTTNEVIPVSDTTTAEAVKVFEGLYRDVNIALANELARFTGELGIDVREAIDVANTQPYCDIHDPGPGVGGHCIPYYPYFVLNWLETPAPLLATAREVNDATPVHVVDLLEARIEERGDSLAGSTVVVLGITYRAGVAETRASPAIDICRTLDDRGATVYASDPLVDAEGIPATWVHPEEVGAIDADAVVLATDHEEFDAIDWDAYPSSTVLIDTRDALDDDGLERDVYVVGRGP